MGKTIIKFKGVTAIGLHHRTLSDLPIPRSILEGINIPIGIIADPIVILLLVSGNFGTVEVQAEEIGATLELNLLLFSEHWQTRLGETLNFALAADLEPDTI